MGTFTELETQGHDFNVLLHREEEDDDDAAGVDELETIAEAPAEDIEAAAIHERKESLAHGMVGSACRSEACVKFAQALRYVDFVLYVGFSFFSPA
jgi:hypothetical protein